MATMHTQFNIIGKTSDSEGDWVPGDHGQIVNPAVTDKPAKFTVPVGHEAQTVIYLGGGIFFGHVSGPRKFAKLSEWHTHVKKDLMDKKDKREAIYDTLRIYPRRGLK